ncbi:MAG: hypothetical protein HY754_12780 [Nitrospirae bacterium]|nr:hypothetical protein [Nitrospirota bacterium]
MNWISMSMPFTKEIEKLKTDNRILRNFGILFFIVFCLVSFYVYRRGFIDWQWFLIIGILFLTSGLVKPSLLRRFYKLWMLFALMLGRIMTHIILTITFFVIITPVTIILRISGKDLLNERINKGSETYWIKHEVINDKDRYKKQF